MIICHLGTETLMVMNITDCFHQIGNKASLCIRILYASGYFIGEHFQTMFLYNNFALAEYFNSLLRSELSEKIALHQE